MRFSTLLMTTAAFCSSTLFALSIEPPQPAPVVALENDQTVRSSNQQSFKAIDFSNLHGMAGFSDTALNNHFKLYQGYVTNTNALLTILKELAADGKQKSPQYQEIKRRFGWEFDGMRLHELYFGNLGGQNTKLDPNSGLAKQINNDFGSFDGWKKDFMETGMLRGVGWSVLYFDPVSNRLFNTWIGEHDIGHLAGGKPILIMDVWEHAFMTDYGLDRMAYINAFFSNINWDVVTKRFP